MCSKPNVHNAAIWTGDEWNLGEVFHRIDVYDFIFCIPLNIYFTIKAKHNSQHSMRGLLDCDNDWLGITVPIQVQVSMLFEADERCATVGHGHTHAISVVVSNFLGTLLRHWRTSLVPLLITNIHIQS